MRPRNPALLAHLRLGQMDAEPGVIKDAVVVTE